MNLLITGCAGFIGSHMVDLSIEKGCNVIGVDSLTYASDLENLSAAFSSEKFEFYHLDICDTKDIKNICKSKSIDFIVNFAAETHVDNSIRSVDPFIHSNINGVKSLLDVCRVENIKLLHVSTDEVYGSIQSGEFTECDILNPANPYSATKAAAEHLITAYSNTYGIQYTIVRPSNNFGPRQHSEKFIPTIIRAILSNEKVPIYGNGKNIRDWLYVEKNVQTIFSLLEPKHKNTIYNITSKKEKTNLEIVKTVLKIFEKDFESNVSFVEDRLGHDFRYSISNKKLLDNDIDMDFDFIECLNKTVDEYARRLT
jgi:dTDP-glucose 4,6-dehydratase